MRRALLARHEGAEQSLPPTDPLLLRRRTPLLIAFFFVNPNRLFYGVAFSLGEVGLFLARFGVFLIAVVHDRVTATRAPAGVIPRSLRTRSGALLQ